MAKRVQPKVGDKFVMEGTKDAVWICSACQQPIADGAPARRYVAPNATGTNNEIKASMHEACWQRLYGRGTN